MVLLIPDESSPVFAELQEILNIQNAGGYHPGSVLPSTADPAPFADGQSFDELSIRST